MIVPTCYKVLYLATICVLKVREEFLHHHSLQGSISTCSRSIPNRRNWTNLNWTKSKKKFSFGWIQKIFFFMLFGHITWSKNLCRRCYYVGFVFSRKLEKFQHILTLIERKRNDSDDFKKRYYKNYRFHDQFLFLRINSKEEVVHTLTFSSPWKFHVDCRLLSQTGRSLF